MQRLQTLCPNASDDSLGCMLAGRGIFLSLFSRITLRFALHIAGTKFWRFLFVVSCFTISRIFAFLRTYFPLLAASESRSNHVSESRTFLDQFMLVDFLFRRMGPPRKWWFGLLLVSRMMFSFEALTNPPPLDVAFVTGNAMKVC